MHQQVTAEQCATWGEDQRAGVEIVDGMVLGSPSATKRHNRLARLLANALDVAAGPEWNADTDFDVRLRDLPLNNRRPDVTVYRPGTIDVIPARPEHVLLVVEVVSPGSETTDRIVKAEQYPSARATSTAVAFTGPCRSASSVASKIVSASKAAVIERPQRLTSDRCPDDPAGSAVDGTQLELWDGNVSALRWLRPTPRQPPNAR